MRITIKPNHKLRAKRRYSFIGVMGILFAIQAGRELCNYSSNETWENVLAFTGILVYTTIACIAFGKYRKLIKDENKKTY